MARKNEAESLLREGLYPSAIAKRMGITTATVIQYLYTRVGEGPLRRSDIYFSWPRDKRAILQRVAESEYPNWHLLAENDLDREDYQLFKNLRDPNVFRGDLFEFLSQIEISIHKLVRRELKTKFGPGELEWWRKGVPVAIRKECVARKEEDDEPSEDPFAYTTLINLWSLLKNHWTHFLRKMPKHYQANRTQLEDDLRKLNSIRNRVMHPVKDKKWSEDEFDFVRKMHRDFCL